mmetsp:Transcript_45471/g.145939  ORF Transcript_45471/g.145939 Transcript_45471/m.145939 type:complete len:144 (+) Transcript_45471:137-568(+)
MFAVKKGKGVRSWPAPNEELEDPGLLFSPLAGTACPRSTDGIIGKIAMSGDPGDKVGIIRNCGDMGDMGDMAAMGVPGMLFATIGMNGSIAIVPGVGTRGEFCDPGIPSDSGDIMPGIEKPNCGICNIGDVGVYLSLGCRSPA